MRIVVIILKRKITWEEGGIQRRESQMAGKPKIYWTISNHVIFFIELFWCAIDNISGSFSQMPFFWSLDALRKSLIARKWSCSNQPQPLPSFLEGNIVTSRRPTTPLSCLPSLGCGSNLIETSKTMSETIMWGSAASVEAATRVVNYALQALKYVISAPSLCE